MFINLEARNGSGLVSQYFVWPWPLIPDHLLHHKSLRCVSRVGIMFFLLGTLIWSSYMVFPPAYSNQSQFKDVTMM